MSVKVTIVSQEYGIREVTRSEALSSKTRPQMDIYPKNSSFTTTTTFNLNDNLDKIKGVDASGQTVMQSNKVMNYILKQTKFMDDSLLNTTQEINFNIFKRQEKEVVNNTQETI